MANTLGHHKSLNLNEEMDNITTAGSRQHTIRIGAGAGNAVLRSVQECYMKLKSLPESLRLSRAKLACVCRCTAVLAKQ
jgi:hypothetical protein